MSDRASSLKSASVCVRVCLCVRRTNVLVPSPPNPPPALQCDDAVTDCMCQDVVR